MKLCPYCKVALERDDAQFCQNCGKPTSSHSLSSAASSAASPAVPQPEPLEDTLRVPVVKKARKNQPSLPEQIAQQPRPRTPISQAESPVPAKKASRPAPSTKTFTAPPAHTEPPAQQLPGKSEEQHTTASPMSNANAQNTPMPTSPPPLDALPSTPPPPVSQKPQTGDREPKQHDGEEEAIEKRPIRLLEPDATESSASQQTAAEEAKKEHLDAGKKQAPRPVLVQPIPAKFSAFPDAVSRMTSPLPPVAQPKQPTPPRLSELPATVRRLTSPLVPAAQSIPTRFSELPATIRRLTAPLVPAAQSIPARLLELLATMRGLMSSRSMSARLSELPTSIRGLASSAPAALSPALHRARQRLSVSLVAAVLVALVLVGAVSWLVIDQPFSVPPVTRPQLDFNDARLGLSLRYPNGWTSQKNASDSLVQFSDSSHTAQVNIAVSHINTATITASLQKQSAQLGMSGVKSVAPLSFAGASWQGLQGTVQQSGASYTCTIFATTHANHLVMLTQMAPQSVYDQEESVIFSALRQSLRFV